MTVPTYSAMEQPSEWVLVPNYPEENVVKQGDKETGTSNVFQILQDLRLKQYQGNSETKAY